VLGWQFKMSNAEAEKHECGDEKKTEEVVEEGVEEGKRFFRFCSKIH
jgi:hypothetical protein